MTHHLNRNDERPPHGYDPDATLEPDSIDQHGRRYDRYKEYEASQAGNPKGVTNPVPF